MTYTIHILDRNYTTWEVVNTHTQDKVELDINIIESKLFHNDVFAINKGKIVILDSPIRSKRIIAGVLILHGNKTYGKERKLVEGQTYTKKKMMSAAGRALYKFIPNDAYLPAFLVPYEMKHIGFSKVFQNIYATVLFEEWQDKHPKAKLDAVIGPVDVLDHFYEYQLYCKNLHISIQTLQKSAHTLLANTTHNELISRIISRYPSIEDRTSMNVITIDPLNCMDFDDGFSITRLDNGVTKLSVYISNVTVWMDILQLWNSFSRRISTIYLPGKKRPMLPTILSDDLCSLLENVSRVAFVMDLFIKDRDFDEVAELDIEIVDITFSTAIIKVAKNYVYEEPALLIDANYQYILQTVKTLSKRYTYINTIADSHDVVAYLMILMNYYSARELLASNVGIFRSVTMNNNFSVPPTLREDIGKFIKILHSSSGKYIDINVNKCERHDLLDLDAYIHITSPIRRLVDILNMIKLQRINKIITLSDEANLFYDNWVHQLDYINDSMKAIRKVQNECSLLELCSTNPAIMDKEYECYVFDKVQEGDLYKYTVLLSELKITSRVKWRENIENFTQKKGKLYVFNDEANFKRKIRIQFI
jgi:exoribonuclease R